MSSERAKHYHSINIGNKNTWDDWHLVPTSRPLVSPPSVRTNIIDIPGSSEIIDLTEFLAGRPTYGNRSGSWEFIVINSKQLIPNSSYGEWYNRYSTIMDYLHGQSFDIILDDDPGYYYTGRLSVNDWNSAKGNSLITINYNVDPYKRDIRTANGNWLWDPFNFETGVARAYKNLIVRNTLTITYIVDVADPIPLIQCSANGMTVAHGGTTYSLRKGINTMNEMHLAEGNNTLVFTGNGYVSIEVIGGIL